MKFRGRITIPNFISTHSSFMFKALRACAGAPGRGWFLPRYFWRLGGGASPAAGRRLMMRISRKIRSMAIKLAAPSAMGPAYITPSMLPMTLGSRIIRGSRKMICRVIEIKMPILALPMEVKKLAVRGWMPLRKVIKRKMRKYCSAKWK